MAKIFFKIFRNGDTFSSIIFGVYIYIYLVTIFFSKISKLAISIEKNWSFFQIIFCYKKIPIVSRFLNQFQYLKFILLKEKKRKNADIRETPLWLRYATLKARCRFKTSIKNAWINNTWVITWFQHLAKVSSQSETAYGRSRRNEPPSLARYPRSLS